MSIKRFKFSGEIHFFITVINDMTWGTVPWEILSSKTVPWAKKVWVPLWHRTYCNKRLFILLCQFTPTYKKNNNWDFFGLYKPDNIVKKTILNENAHAYLVSHKNCRIWNASSKLPEYCITRSLQYKLLKFIRSYEYMIIQKDWNLQKYFAM